MAISPVTVYGQQLELFQTEVATTVLKRALDINQQQAASLASLIDSQQGIGQNLNLTG